MCGLVLSVPTKAELSIAEQRMVKALNSLKERGPDESGLLKKENILFGHRRLSIIDISSSQQPLASTCGRYTLIYNGEIYNYKELRKKLEKQWAFSTSGDTEVILAGLSLEGPNFVHKLEGMWALAFHDQQEQSILLSRDPFGKKPLFYTGKNLNTGFHASSEIPSLKHLLPTKAKICQNHFLDYWKYGFFLKEKTAYKDIYQVLPGATIKVYQDSPIKTLSTVSQLSRPPHALKNIENDEASIEKIKEALDEAVEKRLVADVEVGCFLSGGLDSSIISHIAQKKADIRTYSMAFEEKSFDESEYATKMAKHLGTNHSKVVFKDPTPEDLESVIFKRIGMPFIDTSIIALDQLCKYTSKDIKVALSGDGADELFGGYQRYGAAHISQKYQKAPIFLRKTIETIINNLKEGHTHHSHSLIKQANLFLQLNDRFNEPYIAPALFTKDQITRLIAPTKEECPTPLSSQSDPIYSMMLSDLENYLPEDILRKVDAASMHHGLEVRCPFLDAKVAQTALKFPGISHRQYTKGKLLLKQCYQSELPEWIWHRKKHGFVTPVAKWFRGELSERLLQLTEEIPNPLNLSFIKSLINDHKQNQDYSSQLWSIYIYLSWLNKES